MMSFRSLAAAILASTLPLAQAAATMSAAGTCGQPGQWLIPPATGAGPAASSVAATELLDRLARKQVVLLGENHSSADDHRWQLDVLTALQQRHPDLAIGFEMFPRRVQGVLDRWVAGQLTEAEFLRQAEWEVVWRFDAELYLPLFRFARQHRLPMLALNVERRLVNQVRAAGWEGTPEAQREGVGRPAEPPPLYRRELQAVFDEHPDSNNGDEATRFARFVAAQTLWDRAMAEGIARFRHDHPATLVVGILGAGHVRHGHGVPHQLKALGGDQSANLLTLPSDHPCSELTAGLADAVYVIPPQPEWGLPAPPRLGVSLKEVPDGVMIETVMPGSLAERSGLRNGDIIVQAAGNKVGGIEEVRAYVRRQPAGTSLPLLIQRAGWNLEIVVRFPANTESAVPGKP
jgi:uncharacterized iron-regulated protein